LRPGSGRPDLLLLAMCVSRQAVLQERLEPAAFELRLVHPRYQLGRLAWLLVQASMSEVLTRLSVEKYPTKIKLFLRLAKAALFELLSARDPLIQPVFRTDRMANLKLWTARASHGSVLGVMVGLGSHQSKAPTST